VGAIEDLYRQVWLRPDDDGARLVLADALLATGDPRGELIQIQLDRKPGMEPVAMRLLQQHGLRWLGELRGAVTPLAYERGFLASCILRDPALARGCDEWATVHTVEANVDLAYFDAPVMRSLHTVILEQDPDRLVVHYEHGVARRLEAAYTPSLAQAIATVRPTLVAIEIEDVPDELAPALTTAIRARHPHVISLVVHPRVYRY
jgi:uncharacterized protein (TIGR02996 family)